MSVSVTASHLACAALASATIVLAGCAHGGQPTPRVSRAVVDAVTATGRARVLVTLREPAAAAREGAIAAAQEAIIARLPAGEFGDVRRYASVPGLALTVTSRGLDVLRTDPRVGAIELDEGGGGNTRERR